MNIESIDIQKAESTQPAPRVQIENKKDAENVSRCKFEIHRILFELLI